MSEHPDIRKLGFTGSTPIGKTIMKRYYGVYDVHVKKFIKIVTIEL